MNAKLAAKLVAAAMLAATAASARSAAVTYSFNHCPLPRTAAEGFATSIRFCEDAARLTALKGLPEGAAMQWYALAQLYHLDRQYDKAVEGYTRSLAIMRNTPDVLMARGDAYQALGKSDLAKADYAAAAALKTYSPEDLATRCWVRTLRGGPFGPALEDCDGAVTAMPNDPTALGDRCMLHYRRGEFAAALADCGAALALAPDYASARYFRGLAKLKSGDAAGGEADVAAALGMNRHLADAYGVFGMTR
jgi:tetratricopeptide (TPR) repeat protein